MPYDVIILNFDVTELISVVRKLDFQPGRPKFQIPEETLRFLFDKRFTVKETASLLGVSQRTFERRMRNFGIRIGDCYSSIDDHDLESIVNNIIRDFPNIGYKRMSALLFSRGLRIQQNRVRETMRQVDPCGTLFRALSLRPVLKTRALSLRPVCT